MYGSLYTFTHPSSFWVYIFSADPFAQRVRIVIAVIVLLIVLTEKYLTSYQADWLTKVISVFTVYVTVLFLSGSNMADRMSTMFIADYMVALEGIILVWLSSTAPRKDNIPVAKGSGLGQLTKKNQPRAA